MKITRIIAIALMTASLGIAAAQAKTLRKAEEPAEFPPASFKGKQYVDSRGCVYIRAGIDGLTTWVPRVTRSREVLCGYQPTFAKAPVATPDPARTQTAQVITPAAPAKPAPAAKPAAAAPVATASKPAQVAKPVVRRVAKPVVPAPAPRKVKVAAPKPAPQPAPYKVVRAAPATPAPAPVATAPATSGRKVVKARPGPKSTRLTSCEGVTGISRYYAGVSTDRYPVRCGPQTEPYVTVVSRSTVTVVRNGKPVQVTQRVATQQPVVAAAPVAMQPVPPSAVTPNTRIVPRHVYEAQQAARINAAEVPSGYRPAWKDDRLNRKRAHQTIAGYQATQLAWTNTVPRKLYERATGRVVNRIYPRLVYPYTSMAEQNAAGVIVATKSEAAAMKKKAATARVSTKAAPAPVRAAVSGRFVQVGMFGVPANAQKAAARLQGSGLPVRLGRLTRGGKDYRIVLAGPFAPDQIGAALATSRRAGFADAFVRK
jgi:hypothetical protein